MSVLLRTVLGTAAVLLLRVTVVGHDATLTVAVSAAPTARAASLHICVQPYTVVVLAVTEVAPSSKSFGDVASQSLLQHLSLLLLLLSLLSISLLLAEHPDIGCALVTQILMHPRIKPSQSQARSKPIQPNPSQIQAQIKPQQARIKPNQAKPKPKPEPEPAEPQASQAPPGGLGD